MEDISKQQAKILFDRAYRQQVRGNFSEAIALYRQSLELQPTAEAFTFLGWTYSILNRYDEAIEQCKLAIEVDPDYGNPYNDIGSYLIALGRSDEAVEWLEQATQATRYDAPQFPYINMGKAYEQQGRNRSALQAYDRALLINPLDQAALRPKYALLAKMN
ncbi:MAG: tetratricopeptide (TPR) repeat protein [Cellvibrionaceae bacterium]|jgi:tetratricopeptide (TPR) repeat protein